MYNYGQLYEPNTSPTLEEGNLMSQETNHKKLPALLSKYVKTSTKSKYDVGKIRIEPRRIHLTSELSISLRAYRTSPKKKTEIKEQIQNLLQDSLHICPLSSLSLFFLTV